MERISLRKYEHVVAEASDLGMNSWPRQISVEVEGVPMKANVTKVEREPEGDIIAVTYSVFRNQYSHENGMSATISTGETITILND